MVEFIFVETHNVKIPAVVIAVTADALFPFCLSRCMESGPPVNPEFYFLMTTQAFVVGHFVAQHMAFRAVEHTFQTGMRLRQIARRQLCSCLRRKEEEEQEDM